jgi:hypothetical protein
MRPILWIAPARGSGLAPTVPGAPGSVTAVGNNGNSTVSFTAPSNGNSPITSYTATANAGGFSTSGASSPLIVTGTNGTPYTYTVTATNAIGTGPAGGPSNSVTPSAGLTVPGAPTIGTATGGNGQATVTFSAPGSNGGSAITSYTATANSGGFTASGAGSPITVTGLTNGTPYTFTVTATNAIGTGAASGASNSVTPAVASNLVMYADGVLDSRWPSSYDYSYGSAPAWSSATAYVAGKYVVMPSFLNYMCILGHTNQAPPNATYWVLTTNGPSGGTVDNLRDPYGPQAGHTYSWALAGQYSGIQQSGVWDVAPFGVDISGYIQLQFDLFVPAGGGSFALFFHYSRSGGDDIATCCLITDITQVTGALTANAWNTGLTFRLSTLGALGSTAYYKWAINQSVAGPLKIDNVKFLPGTTTFIYNNNALLSGWTAAVVNGSVNTTFSPNSLGPAFYAINQSPAGATVASALCMKVTTTAVTPSITFTKSGGLSVSDLTRFTFGQLPTKAGYGYSCQFLNTSAVLVGNAVTMAPYTLQDFGIQASPQNWTVFDAPLSAFGAIGATIGGVRITETSGNTTNAFYLSAPAFTS